MFVALLHGFGRKSINAKLVQLAGGRMGFMLPPRRCRYVRSDKHFNELAGCGKVEVSQLLKLGRGAVVELDRKLGEAVDIMRTIKRAMDPQNLLNPGKIFSL